MLLDYAIEDADVPLNVGAAGGAGSEPAFEASALNVLDLLVFSSLANFDFPSPCIGAPLSEAMLSAQIPHVLHRRKQRLVQALLNDDDVDLAAIVSMGSRYSSVYVHDFAARFEPDESQFAALALAIDDVLVCVFRGTDETFTGWRESLRLSLDDPVPSQLDAVEFFTKQADSITGPIVLCGHSKGGNLAAYAAASCGAATSDRIASVVGFDAPGLPARVRHTQGYERLVGRLVNFVPQGSVVGNVHDYAPGALRYIKSRGISLAQHYPYRWETAGDRFIASKQTFDSKLFSRGLGVVVKRIPDGAKAIIINGIFNALKLTGRTTF